MLKQGLSLVLGVVLLLISLQYLSLLFVLAGWGAGSMAATFIEVMTKMGPTGD